VEDAGLVHSSELTDHFAELSHHFLLLLILNLELFSFLLIEVLALLLL
jgi:hypothetical protein